MSEKPSADATAGPYYAERASTGVWCVNDASKSRAWSRDFVENCSVYPDDGQAKQEIRARTLALHLNRAFAAGRASTREPTEAMLQAGAAALRNPLLVHHPDGQGRDDVDDARAVWDAMWKARDD